MNGGTDVDLILAIQLQEQFEEELKNYNKSPDNSNAAIQIISRKSIIDSISFRSAIL